MLLAGFAYASSLHLAMSAYLNPVWEYYGFTYSTPGLAEILLAASLLAATSLTMPTTLSGPANIIVLALYVIVYVPTVVISLDVVEGAAHRYGMPLLTLTLVFVVACRLVADAMPAGGGLLSRRAELVLLAAWLSVGAYLVVRYGSVMSLAGLEQIYEQRAAGTAENAMEGYAQTYFGAVLSPALVAIGLVRHRLAWIAAGNAGFVIFFMIAANRTIILMPLVMMGLFVVLRAPWRVLRSSALYVAFLPVPVIWASLNHDAGQIGSILATYLVFRTLSLPGLMFSQYYDLFSSEGFTWWSHVKGLSLVAPAPFLAEHPAWPGLGYIVGDLIYKNVENNHNANLFAADGVAAAGTLGVLLIGAAFAAWLKLLEWASRRWDVAFTTMALASLALVLTNGQFFTVLLSFGGAFWLLIFWFAKPTH